MIPKFRAWKTIGTNEMFHNVVAISWNNNKIAVLYPNPGRNTFRIDEESLENVILMQSTALKDKNGVDVYQGDIIRCASGCPHEVIWLEEYGGTFLGGMPAWYLSGLSNGYAWTGREEVIGNIYENSELLEVE
ncbi:TPA: DNA-packaging protein [Enterococcus faecium]|nr:DNA-packaging protein [Enterococcus faecium]